MYLRNSGSLSTVFDPGRTVYWRPATAPGRKTDFDAITVDVNVTVVTVDSVLPNNIVHACVVDGLRPQLREYRIETPKPTLPDGGRADFLVTPSDGTRGYIEVTSNTHVVDGVSKFPDRPTERGCHQLQSLIDLVTESTSAAFVVFVIQRPDGVCFQPFASIDPEFADLLHTAADEGVKLLAVTTQFTPPEVSLMDNDIPIRLDT